MTGNAPIILSAEEYPQRSPQWHDAHIGIPTASAFKDIMPGERVRYKDEWWSYLHLKVAERILGRRLQKSTYVSRAMQNGIDREPEGRRCFELEHPGKKVREIGFAYEPGKRWGGSPDGLIGDNELLELKCPEEWTEMGYLLNSWKTAEHMPQVIGNMMILNADVGYLYGYHPDFPPYKMIFYRDNTYDTYVKRLTERLEEFCLKLDSETERARDMFDDWKKKVAKTAF